jgi:O-methyltransferase / aklanonic acid methyltransferase
VNSEVTALWERAAETYETEVPYFALMGERIVAQAQIESGESVLDVACGKGATAIPAARHAGPAGRVIGIDIVPAMVAATRLAARDAGLDNVTAEVMDGEALEFDDETFDVVICAFGLGFLRPEVALPEMARVLRRPGRLVASAPAGGGPNWEFFGELCERYGVASAAHPGGTKMPTPAEMASVFTQAGFALAQPVLESVPVMFPDSEAWWRWAWSHGQRAFLERLDDAQLRSFREDADRAIAGFATPDGVPLEQRFMVVTAQIG